MKKEKLIQAELSKLRAMQLAKSTALNAIRKIYHPKFDGYSNTSWNDSYSEQRDYMVRSIIAKLDKEIKNIKTKYSKKINHEPNN